MARVVAGEPGFDRRDTELLNLLAEARVLSTAQLAELAFAGEPLGRLVERLKRLAISGWLGCLARVPGPRGSVTAWFRSDMSIGADRLAYAAEVIRLNGFLLALRGGARRYGWAMTAAEPVVATLEVPGERRFFLTHARDEVQVVDLCRRFADYLRGPESTYAIDFGDGLAPEVLVLASGEAQRDRLRAVAMAWHAREADEPFAIHVTRPEEARRVLRTLVHGELLPVESMPPPVTREPDAQERAALTTFFGETLH